MASYALVTSQNGQDLWFITCRAGVLEFPQPFLKGKGGSGRVEGIWMVIAVAESGSEEWNLRMRDLDLSDASIQPAECRPDFLRKSAICDRELAQNSNQQHDHATPSA